VAQIVLKESFLKKIDEKQHAILLATIRIYSVVAMKCKVVVDTFSSKSLNNGEFVDLYSDLFATYFEGVKKYFQEYSQTILEIASVTENDYVKRMVALFRPENAESDSTYKVLNYIRNDFSFHFGIRKLGPIVGAPIGSVDNKGVVTFTSTTPNLFKYIAETTGEKMSRESIQTYYRTVYNEEIRPFVEYLGGVIHSVVDSNVDFV